MSSTEFKDCESNERLDGKVVLITGATSGTGFEAAKLLASRGAKVIIASRNKDKLNASKKLIIDATNNTNIIARQVDFESLNSVRSFVNETINFEPRLDALINNIGAIGLADKLSDDGLQLTMQVNYFSAFLLTFLLFPLLKASAPSRVVNVSSLALLLGDINFNRFNEVGEYSAFGFYCNAKLADVLFTNEIAKRTAGSGVSINSMDPGLGKSDFFRNFEATPGRLLLSAALLKFGRPLSTVAQMSVFLATDPRVGEFNGRHYRDCHMFYSSWLAEDEILRRDLWDYSKRMVKITKEEDWETLNG